MEIQKAIAQQISEEMLKKGLKESSKSIEDYNMHLNNKNGNEKKNASKTEKVSKVNFQKSLSAYPFSEKVDKELRKAVLKRESSQPDKLTVSKSEKEIKMIVFKDNKEKDKEKEKEKEKEREKEREKEKEKKTPPVSPRPRSNSLSFSAEFLRPKSLSSSSPAIPPPSTKIFNVSLNAVMEFQKEKHPHLEIPLVLKTLTEAIISNNGCKSEGLFRIPGASVEINRMRLQFDGMNFSVTTTDPHVLASLLKLWLRELPDALIPTSLYYECIRCYENGSDCLKVLESLPAINKRVVNFLIKFLQKVASPENEKYPWVSNLIQNINHGLHLFLELVRYTMMGIDNISMVFAPGFLRCPSNDPTVMMINSQKEKDFLMIIMQKLK